MKKMLLILSTFIVGASPILVTSCKASLKEDVKEIEEEPIPPNYNLVEHLVQIN